MATIPWEAIIPAMPILAGAIRFRFNNGDRGLPRRIARADKAVKMMTDPDLKASATRELDRLCAELAHREGRAARRAIDGSSLAAILLIMLVATSISLALWNIALWGKVIAGVITAVATLFMLVGAATTLVKTKDTFPFEDTASDTIGD